MRFLHRITRFFHFKRLITKLILLYSILIVAVLSISSVFFYIYYRTTLEDRSISYTLENLNQMQHNIEINLEQVEQLSMILVSSDAIQNYLTLPGETRSQEMLEVGKNVGKLCIDVMVSRNDIESVSVYTDDGNFAGTNMSDEFKPYYTDIKEEAAAQRGRLCWIYLNEPSPSILAVRVIYNTKTLQPDGLLIIKYRRSAISRIIAGSLKNTDGTTYILDGQDRIIAAQDFSLRCTSFQIPGIDSEQNGLYSQISVFGEPSVATVLQSSYNGWRYIGTVPQSSLSVDTGSLLLFIILTLFGSSVLGVAFSGIIARSVAKPIRKLTTYLQNADIGDLHLAQYSSRDEFSFLFESYNEMLKRIRQLIITTYEQKLLQNEMEIKILHMQINPHFLYNTLDTVYYMAIDRRDHEIAQIIKSLADMMRYSISGGKDILTQVSNEIQHAENYCAIQKIRMGEKLEYYFDIADELLDQKIPRLTFQPFVENCIRHGIDSATDRPLSVEVAGYREEDRCIFQIMDDGVGLDQETCTSLSEHMGKTNFSNVHGIAIPNINAQIKRLYGEKYGVSFEAHNQNGGATFIITIPYRAEEKE